MNPRCSHCMSLPQSSMHEPSLSPPPTHLLVTPHAGDFSSSDPYVRVSLKHQVFETACIPKTLNPVWNDAVFSFLVYDKHHECVTLEVFDRDLLETYKTPLGDTQLFLDDFYDGKSKAYAMELSGVKTGKIYFRVAYFSLLKKDEAARRDHGLVQDGDLTLADFVDVAVGDLSSAAAGAGAAAGVADGRKRMNSRGGGVQQTAGSVLGEESTRGAGPQGSPQQDMSEKMPPLKLPLSSSSPPAAGAVASGRRSSGGSPSSPEVSRRTRGSSSASSASSGLMRWVLKRGSLGRGDADGGSSSDAEGDEEGEAGDGADGKASPASLAGPRLISGVLSISNLEIKSLKSLARGMTTASHITCFITFSTQHVVRETRVIAKEVDVSFPEQFHFVVGDASQELLRIKVHQVTAPFGFRKTLAEYHIRVLSVANAAGQAETLEEDIAKNRGLANGILSLNMRYRPTAKQHLITDAVAF